MSLKSRDSNQWTINDDFSFFEGVKKNSYHISLCNRSQYKKVTNPKYGNRSQYKKWLIQNMVTEVNIKKWLILIIFIKIPFSRWMKEQATHIYCIIYYINDIKYFAQL